jgi:hypothetical protein
MKPEQIIGLLISNFADTLHVLYTHSRNCLCKQYLICLVSKCGLIVLAHILQWDCLAVVPIRGVLLWANTDAIAALCGFPKLPLYIRVWRFFFFEYFLSPYTVIEFLSWKIFQAEYEWSVTWAVIMPCGLLSSLLFSVANRFSAHAGLCPFVDWMLLLAYSDRLWRVSDYDMLRLDAMLLASS